MISSGANQYLRPEYLTPLPTTLDAKKSPLALLAQTCSQIGADSSSSKLVSSLDKHKKSESRNERDKASPASSVGSNISAGDNKTGFKPYDTPPRKDSPDNGSRTPGKSSGTPVPPPSRTGSHSASPRASPRRTPASHEMKLEGKSDSRPSPQSAPLPRSVPSPPPKLGFSPSLLSCATDPLLKDIPLGTFKPSAGLPLPTGLLPGYPPPMDLMASSFLSPHVLKAAGNPYLNYARLKASDGLICRDPYCTGCQLSGKPPCPGGCVQCDHTSKTPFSPAAYAHAQLAALAAASQLPYVCNWIAGDAAYCGKRFSNSEELLQHLKTHTSGSESSLTPGLPLLSPTALPLLHRTYPTPPLSPLATARYHPYSKGPLIPPSFSSLGFPLHPHPSLSPYLSPYALYGQRLGSSAMHP